MTSWWAPGRVTLIGDHTDYSGGWVLPFALTVGTTVEATLTLDGTLTVRSAGFGEQVIGLDELAAGRATWARYVEGAVAQLRSAGAQVPGLEIEVRGELPAGGGLASSASVTCAVLAAVAELTGPELSRDEVARTAQRVENEYVGAPVGFMDPAAVMSAEADHAMLIDCATGSITQVPLALESADVSLVAVDTGHGHTTAGRVYAQRVAECRAAARALGVDQLSQVGDPSQVDRLEGRLRSRARHVVSENDRVLRAADALRRGDMAALGSLMVQSHESLRDDYRVSSDLLDLVVETAMSHGALGARLTGAGMGGSALVLADRRHLDAVELAVTESLAGAGCRAARLRRVRPGPAAHPRPPEQLS